MEEQTKQTEPVVSEVKNEMNSNGQKSEEKKSSSNIPLIIIAVVLVLAGLIYLFIRLTPETTGKIRDITLIITALGTIVTITSLVVLVVQLAKLVNFLKYELSPIITTTDKTVKKFSGTVSFLCDNAVEPTVKAASTLSGIKNAASGVLSLFKKS